MSYEKKKLLYSVRRALSLHALLTVCIYKEYHSERPLVGIGTFPTPLSPASVSLPPEPGGGAHSPAGEGLGESQFRRLEKRLSTLPTLWREEMILYGKVENYSYMGAIANKNHMHRGFEDIQLYM